MSQVVLHPYFGADIELFVEKQYGIHEWFRWEETGKRYTKTLINILGSERNMGTVYEMKRICKFCGETQVKVTNTIIEGE
jgi:hypothetical protein